MTTSAGADTARHARFAERAEAAGSRVWRVDTWDEVAALVADRAGDGVVALPPSLADALPGLLDRLQERGVRTLVPGSEDPVAEVVDAPVGVVRGHLAVAETGSVLLDEHDVADRAVSMLSLRLVQVVEASAVVDSLDDVAAWLSARSGRAGFVSLVTGPSRSADIERSLTIGVQGPYEVEVVLLTESQA